MRQNISGKLFPILNSISKVDLDKDPEKKKKRTLLLPSKLIVSDNYYISVIIK